MLSHGMLMRFRNELREVVREMVRTLGRAVPDAIRKTTAGRGPGEFMPEFVSMVISELHHLHPGNLMRYHLCPAEFEAWKKRNARSSPLPPAKAGTRPLADRCRKILDACLRRQDVHTKPQRRRPRAASNLTLRIARALRKEEH